MNILILGGYGYTGKLLTKHLLQQTRHKVIVAGRHIEQAQALVDELNDARASARSCDAGDSTSLRQALRGVDFLLVAAPTTHQTGTAVRAALDAGIDYLDVQFSQQKIDILKAHAGEIKRRGLCFVTEAGFHPGLPSALIRYAASKMDKVQSALTAGFLNMRSLPYTEAVDELMEGFVHYQAQVYKDSAWTKPNAWQMRKFDFGPEFGKRDCYSMFFEELRRIPRMYPSLKEAGFYISGTNWLTDLIITPIILLGLAIAPKRGLRPLGKLMWWSMMRASRPPYRVVLVVEARGVKKHKPIQVRARVEHEDGYELTAIPVVAFLKQYAKVRSAGLHMMGHLAEPNRLMKDMQLMGVRVTTDVEI